MKAQKIEKSQSRVWRVAVILGYLDARSEQTQGNISDMWKESAEKELQSAMAEGAKWDSEAAEDCKSTYNKYSKGARR